MRDRGNGATMRTLRVFSGLAVGLFASLLAYAQVNVTTARNDISRTGQNVNETTLTLANVNATQFGKLFAQPVDGYIYAQPLYLSGVTVNGAVHNVVFVATEHDSVYAFDADSTSGANSAPLWKASMLTAAHGATPGETTGQGNGDINPEIGITGTPVIDAATGTLYVVSKTIVGGTEFERLHALDVTTGAEKAGSPVNMNASVPGTGVGSQGGMVPFLPLPLRENQRPGLLLLNGVVYIGFAGHIDTNPWHGWVLAYNATTLSQVGVFCATPNDFGGGIWMSGTGLAADQLDPVGHPYGRMFAPTGNGGFNATAPYDGTMNFGDSIITLDLTNGAPTVVDDFTPSDQAQLEAQDVDVAAGGLMILPPQPGAHPNLLVQAGKSGTLYLLDRDNLGGYHTTDQAVQSSDSSLSGVYSSPAYWNGHVYYAATGDHMKSFPLVNGLLTLTPTKSLEAFDFPGATPSISANGNTQGIAWAIDSSGYADKGPAILSAHDASNVASTLYSSATNAARDAAGPAVKFTVPTIANGKVYVGTANQLDVYGLLSGATQTAVPSISPTSQSFTGSLSVTITDGTPSSTIYYTTDGSAATTSSNIYAGPITVTSTLTINAIATSPSLLTSSQASATYTQSRAATPAFTPAGGTYSSPQSVTLSDSTSGATIYYTTDGSIPTTASPVYAGAIPVSSTTTIKAVAAASGYASSLVASATYTIGSQPVAATPTFNPAGGAYSSAQSVTVSDATVGATIYYTTDGSTPTTASTVYSGAISVSASGTLKAIAAKSGYTNSAVATAAYTINTGGGGTGSTPSYPSGFTTSGLGFNGGASVSGGALVLTDGGNVEGRSAWYTTPVNVQQFTTDFTFQLTAPGANTADGFTFTLQNVGLGALGDAGGGLGYQGIGTSLAAKFDLFSSAGEGPDSTGFYTNGASPTTPAVSMSSSGVDLHSGDTMSAHLVYDGTTLTLTITDQVTTASFTTSTTIDIPATVGGNTAYVGFTGGTGGYTAVQQILSWTYSSSAGSGPTPAATPTFTPAGGTYTSAQSVSLSDTTSGATIYYTTDGSTPTTASPVYAGAIAVSSTTTIKAIAAASGFTTSAVASATYTINTTLPTAATPTFTPAGGTYTSAQSVSLSDTTPGATIYYTTDGSAPTTTSAVYSAPIAVGSTQTLKAIAVASGYTTSAVGSAAYTINTGGGGSGSTPSYPSGFTTDGLGFNGGASVSGGALVLTDGGNVEGRAAWYTTPVNVQQFTTDFTFQLTAPGANTADGFTFTLQNVGLGALGAAGGGLGYQGVGTSVAVKFDLFSGSGEGPDSTGFYTNGATPEMPAVSMSSSGVDLHSGDTMSAHLVYDGTTLTLTITDQVTTASFTTSTAINIPATVGGNTAYVGFTGGTGGYTAVQQILSWTYSSSGSGPTLAATPTFTPAGGTYTSAQSVSLSDATPGATIYYTADGSSPTPASPVYAGAIAVSSTQTIKAIATASGYTTSAVASATYTINTGLPTAATPTFTPAAGTYTSAQSVTLSDATPGATINYTTDGTTPTTSSAVYTAPIAVGSTQTIKAIATASGYTTSAVASAKYTINITLPKAATPTFDPAAGAYTAALSVTLSDTTPGATIYYTTNGTTPTTASAVYSTPITVGSTQTIKAIATASGYTTSAVASAAYTITLPKAATPTFAPAAGTYTSAQSVTLSDTSPGASIYYTTDGTTPTTLSAVYTGPIAVGSTQTIKAIATASGFTTSAVASAKYTINITLPKAVTPTFTPSAGAYGSTQNVALSDLTPGATIYYTIDGSTPSTASTVYTGSITVSSTQTIKAIAAASGYANSAVGTAAYTIIAGGGGPGSTPSYPSGFTTGGLGLNGGATVSGAALVLTDGGNVEGRAAWYSTPVNVQQFTTDFTFQLTAAGANTADGFTFTLQNVGLGALGAAGAGLGYQGIGTSIAVKFDLFSSSGEGPDSTGFYTNGAAPTMPAVSMSSSGVDLHSGDTMSAHLVYDGTTLTLTVTDQVTTATFTNSETINIPATVGGNTAYVGFTGGTGGYTAVQKVLSWTYSSAAGAGTSPAATPAFTPAGGTYTSAQNVSLSDTTTGATIYYTTDGSTPTTASSLYTGPIAVGSTQTIKAIAVASGYTTSAVASGTYTINITLPTAATPAFTPAAGTYASAQSVSLSDTTAGATIYYTTDGSTPTTASAVYSTPIAVNSTETLKAIAAASGYTTSAVGAAAYTINTGGGDTGSTPSYPSGFTTSGLGFNGGATVSGGALVLTDGGNVEGRSAWYSTPVNVQRFTSDFTFQLNAPGATSADGFTFTIQNVGPGVVGTAGSGLGYQGIGSSVALKFDVFSSAGEGPDSIGLYTNGAAPTMPAVNLTPSGVDLHSGDTMSAHVVYDGTTLTLTITDQVTSASFTDSETINIPATVGGNTAYVGFTGGTGGYTAVQNILTWTYTPN
ncbi:MAG TPA: chitobiase/beta-hexosaminidase C-terminal domain-containing protein [Steroidobacteraceae bacterium]|jgi:hypothetical protein